MNRISKIIHFNGIKFYNEPFINILRKLLFRGGYLVAPAASSLSEIYKKKKYHNSLVFSDVAIFDSGFFCILLRLFKGLKVKKLSGYLFLKLLLDLKNVKSKKFYLINPNLYEDKKNFNLLRLKNIFNQRSYISPKYNLSNYYDYKLINEINKFNPDFIIINLGGGIQEPLGRFIKLKLKNKKTVILCTGAAISFITKVQAPINNFFDKYYLGWLIRLAHKPKNFFPRVILSLNLIKYF